MKNMMAPNFDRMKYEFYSPDWCGGMFPVLLYAGEDTGIPKCWVSLDPEPL